MADSDGTSCNVCFEPYDLDSKLPRILPCSHSSCESCLQRLVRTNGRRRADTLICPECRKKHITRSGIRAFPYNRYIISHLETKKEVEENRLEKCETHDRDISLYCQSCLKSICPICLLNDHKNHELVDLVHSQKVRSLDDNISQVTKSIEDSLGRFLTSKSSVDRKYTETLETLRRVKREYEAAIDELIEGTLEQKTDFDRKVDSHVETLRAHADKLCGIRNLASKVKTENEVELLAEKVKDIDKEQKSTKQAITYKYHDYDVEKADPNELKNIRGDLLEEETPTGQCDDLDLSVTGVKIIKVLRGGGFVAAVYKRMAQLARMVQYDMYGNELYATDWLFEPIAGFEEVMLGGQACVVTSYLHKGLVFRDAKNVQNVVLDYDDDECELAMCASDPATLFYTRCTCGISNTDPTWYDVVSLDCSKLPLERKTVFKLKDKANQLLCIIDNGKRLLIVCTMRLGHVLAYDATTFLPQWKLNVNYRRIGNGLHGPLRARRLASDERHLFVMDGRKNCILLCSFDGKFKRVFLEDGEKDIGFLWDICWCKQRKSLLVAHQYSDTESFVTSISLNN